MKQLEETKLMYLKTMAAGKMNAIETVVVDPKNWKKYQMSGTAIADKKQQTSKARVSPMNLVESFANDDFFGNRSSSRFALNEKFMRGKTSMR